MSDPIKAALDAATRKGCVCDCVQVQPGCRAQMAQEITVFLRDGMPSAQDIRLALGEVSAQGMRDIHAYHRWLTAMVERAGGGDAA